MMSDEQITAKMMEAVSMKDLSRKCHMPRSFLLRRIQQPKFKETLKKTRLLLINKAVTDLRDTSTAALTMLRDSTDFEISETQAQKSIAAIQNSAEHYRAAIERVLKIQKAESQGLF